MLFIQHEAFVATALLCSLPPLLYYPVLLPTGLGSESGLGGRSADFGLSSLLGDVGLLGTRGEKKIPVCVAEQALLDFFCDISFSFEKNC